MDKYITNLPDARNRVVAVHAVLPGGTAQSILQPGDILWSVEGKVIGADLTILDQTMNTSKSDKLNPSWNTKKTKPLAHAGYKVPGYVLGVPQI